VGTDKFGDILLKLVSRERFIKVWFGPNCQRVRPHRSFVDVMTALSRSDAILTKLFIGILLESQCKESSWINSVFASSVFWLLKVCGCVGYSEDDTQQYPPEALIIKLATNNFSSDFHFWNTLLNKHITSLWQYSWIAFSKTKIKSIIHRQSKKTGSSVKRQPLFMYTGKVNTNRQMYGYWKMLN
jgi:hypothetical protein